MRLKSGTLYWPTTSVPPRAPSTLAGNLRCDALVIGSGISGAMTAYHLAVAGLKVIVVDRRPLVSGSTPASTALVLYEIDSPLIDLAKRVGREGAERSYLATHTALSDMQLLVSNLGGRCDFHSRPSVYLASSPRHVHRLEREASHRQQLGIDASFLGAAQLQSRFNIHRPGAIVSTRAFEVNPVKLTAALFRDAKAHGALIFQNTEIDTSTLVRRRGPIAVRAGSGFISADRIVIATGYEAPEQFAHVSRLTRLKRTYAIATTPRRADPWPERAMIWETGNPYFYARTAVDNRILFGGEDVALKSASHSDTLLASKSNTLLRKLHALAPHIKTRPAFRWSGVFAETADGLPYIGRHKDWSRIFFALGYGGNGLTFSLLAAQIIRDHFVGKKNPNAPLFSFNRTSR